MISAVDDGMAEIVNKVNEEGNVERSK